MSDNRITDIDLLSFAKLSELRYLRLNNSGFRFQNSSTAASADNIKSLVTDLDLAVNGLSNSDVLQRLENMGYVHLHNLSFKSNRFSFIDGVGDVKQKFPNIVGLGLSGNLIDDEYY